MEISPWKLIDTLWLRTAIAAFLTANYARGGDLLPSSKNVDVYLRLGFGGVERGDPCLVGVVGGEPVGFVLWTGTPSPVLDTRWRTINALGSYTTPGARSRGVAGALRDRAWAEAKSLGYERVIGPIHTSNDRGAQEFITVFNAWPTTWQFEALL